MRIVIAGQAYYPAINGQAVFTVQLAEGLAQAGHQVMMLVPATSFRTSCTLYHGVYLQTIAAIPIWRPDIYFTPWPDPQIDRLLDEFQPEIVHLQDHYFLSRSVFRAARKRRLPVIGTNHFLPENLMHYLPVSTWGQPYLNKLLWQSMLTMFNHLNVITTPTETAATILRQQKIQVPIYPVSCGINLNRFYPDPQINRANVRQRYGLSQQQATLLYVGRVDQEKRLDVLLEALHRLNRPDLQVVIAGQGRYLTRLRALAQALALEQHVIFTGYIPAPELPALLNSVDIFAMPSPAELQSIATLEAMATGRPILAAAARALPELVTHGVNGYLFRAGDVADAAHWLAHMVDHPELWATMGATSRVKVLPHQLSHTIQRYEELYHALPHARRLTYFPPTRSYKVARNSQGIEISSSG